MHPCVHLCVLGGGGGRVGEGRERGKGEGGGEAGASGHTLNFEVVVFWGY